MRRACIWRAAVRQIIRRDRKKLPVDLAERKQTRVRTPARSALRAVSYTHLVLRDGQTLHDLYEERVPLYEKYADVIVDEHHLNVEQTIEKIMELKERFQ